MNQINKFDFCHFILPCIMKYLYELLLFIFNNSFIVKDLSIIIKKNNARHVTSYFSCISDVVYFRILNIG